MSSPAMTSNRFKPLPSRILATLRALALVVIGALMSVPAHAETTGVRARVVKAGHQCFPYTAPFTGLVVPRRESIVSQYEIEGYQIEEVLKHDGDTVKTGDVLARLVRLANASPAASSGTMPGGAAATAPPERRPLLARVDGIISRSSAKVGDVAAAVPLPPPLGPEPLFRIAVNKELEVEAEVPSFHLPKIAEGHSADVKLDNGYQIVSQVRTILPLVDRTTQLGKVRLTVGANPATRVGMFARGNIYFYSKRDCSVSVPRTAVRNRPDGKTVQIVRDNIVHTHPVQTGLSDNVDIAIRGDVKEGDLVIANAGSSLRDGDRISPTFADESSPN
jgi:HlyD family secretion protein